MKKKILILGGSAQQVVAIEAAKELGYYTVLCDGYPDNPGQKVCDKFYPIPTTCKEDVLEVAMTEKVDGVFAYSITPAALTAAYVAEQMGLPGNPYKAVEILCNKDKFRQYLEDNDFATTFAKGYDSADAEKQALVDGEFRFPVMVKPIASTESRGVTKVCSWDDWNRSVRGALSISGVHRVLLEEYVERQHKYIIGGDIFVQDGQVVVWGLLNCHRDYDVAPLVSIGKSFPLQVKNKDKVLPNIHETVQRLIDKIGYKNGPMNLEVIVDMKGQVFIIDIAPRAGSNMIPDFLSMIHRRNFVELAVETAMGKETDATLRTDKRCCYATHNIYSKRNGYLRDVHFSEILEPYVIDKTLFKKKGDKIEYFDNSSKAIGILFLKFPNEETMNRILEHITSYYVIMLDSDKDMAPTMRPEIAPEPKYIPTNTEKKSTKDRFAQPKSGLISRF